MYDELIAALRACVDKDKMREDCQYYKKCMNNTSGKHAAMVEAADAIEELSKLSNSLQRLKAEGWCLSRTKHDEYGVTIQSMEIPDQPKKEEI